eukprot:ANDGO_04062.mRNA.1 hypothetical protein CAOG_03956
MEHSVHASHWTHGERRSRENLVFTVLLVGEVGSGKSSLASAFRSFSSTTNIQFEIVTSESYPLPKDTRLDRIDLIVFLANLTAPSTLSSVSAWIKATDPLFLIGRCIVFATHSDRVTEYAFRPSELELITDTCDLVPMHVNLALQAEIDRVVKIIGMRCLRVCGHYADYETPNSRCTASNWRMPVTSSVLFSTLDSAFVTQTRAQPPSSMDILGPASQPS